MGARPSHDGARQSMPEEEDGSREVAGCCGHDGWAAELVREGGGHGREEDAAVFAREDRGGLGSARMREKGGYAAR